MKHKISLEQIEKFISPAPSNKPILFEVFTDYHDESLALEMIRNLDSDALGFLKKKIKENVNYALIETIRKFFQI